MTQLQSASQFRDVGVNPENDPRLKGQNVPNAETREDMSREVRVDADKMTSWVMSHIEHSTADREHLERAWTSVESYMEGFHYFEIDRTGTWRPIPPREGEVREVVPLIRSIYRRELGRFTENLLGVEALPRSVGNPHAFYKARRAEAIVNFWIEDTEFADVFEEWCSQQIHYGLSALHRYVDPIEKEVLSESWGARELHPLPWNAVKDSQLQGMVRCKMMSEEWIEQNFGKEAAMLSGRSRATGPRGGGLGGLGGHAWGSKEQKVARVCWVWILPTLELPSGQYFVLIEDEMWGYRAGLDEQGNSLAMPNGQFPFELSRYQSQQTTWYGMGMTPTLIGPQRNADRSLSRISRSSRLNNGILLFNDNAIDSNDLFDEEQSCIAFDMGAYGSQEKLYDLIPPVPQQKEIGASLQISQDLGRQAAGHESDILFGKAEGRVESGPLGRILNVNAQAPVAATFQRIRRKLVRHYAAVLDMTSEVWPADKRIPLTGQFSLANEMAVGPPGERPSSLDVQFSLSPLLPAGRSEMANLLFQLRQMAGDDGKPELSSAEFRRGLAAIGMAPRCMTLVSKQDERIRQRIAELFNDGKTPGGIATDSVSKDLLQLEDQRKFGEALRDMILDPAFEVSASPQVKRAFLEAMRDVRSNTLGDPFATQGIDEITDEEAFTANKMEEFLDSAEQRPDLEAGTFQLDGLPV